MNSFITKEDQEESRCKNADTKQMLSTYPNKAIQALIDKLD